MDNNFIVDVNILKSYKNILEMSKIDAYTMQARISRFYNSLDFKEKNDSFDYLFNRSLNLIRFNSNLSFQGPPTDFNHLFNYLSFNDKFSNYNCAVDLLEKALEFLSLYNNKFEDRSDFVTRDVFVKYNEFFLPALIAFICLSKDYRFMSENHLNFSDGMITLSFSSRYSSIIDKYTICDIIFKTIEFKLFESVGLISRSICNLFFLRENVAIAREINNFNGGFVQIFCIYDKSSLKKVSTKIIYFLMLYHELGRKELAQLCNASDRTINLALHNLLIDGKISISKDKTRPHSPFVKYKVNI